MQNKLPYKLSNYTIIVMYSGHMMGVRVPTFTK